jgi:hypothetical protein
MGQWNASDVVFLEEMLKLYPPAQPEGAKCVSWEVVARLANARADSSMGLGGARKRYARMQEEFVATPTVDEDSPVSARAHLLLKTLYSCYGTLADSGMRKDATASTWLVQGQEGAVLTS